MEFSDKWAAVVWMCHNQLGRRNLKDYHKDVLVAEASRAKTKSIGGNRGNQYTKLASDQSGHLPKGERTRSLIAKQFGVGEGTVQRAEQFLDGLNAAEEVSPGFKTAILSGEVKAPKSIIAEIRKMEPTPNRTRPKKKQAHT